MIIHTKISMYIYIDINEILKYAMAILKHT